MKILLIVYDNDTSLHYFPIGLAYIASALRMKGHEVSIYQQDVYKNQEKHLTEYLDNHSFDMVGIGVIGGYYQYRKLLNISDAINASRQKPFYVIGGHGPSPEPKYFLKKTGAEAVIVGEGEKTIVELCKGLEKKTPLNKIKGIAFLDENRELVYTGERPLIKNLDSLSFPAWDMFEMDYYVQYRFPGKKPGQKGFPVLTSRGCKYKCNFCYRMDKGLRLRNINNVIEEIKILKGKYDVNFICFADELFMSSEERTRKICEEIIRNFEKLEWYCNGRLNFASLELLRLMKKAGCVFINYGIESMDNNILRIMNKNLDTEQIIKGVENTLNVGISPGLNIIFGNIGENSETLQKGVNFLLKYADTSQLRTIRPVTPYPGSELYYYAIKKRLLKNCQDFYENKHLNSDLLCVNFTELSDEEFYRELEKANEILIKKYFRKKAEETIKEGKKLTDKNDKIIKTYDIENIQNYFKKEMKKTLMSARKLYRKKDVSFRGFR